MTPVETIPQQRDLPRAAFFRMEDDWRHATGKGVSVAIIDSGIDVLHPDLAGKVASSVEARIDNK